MTTFDLVGDRLRHLVEDEGFDIGYDGATRMVTSSSEEEEEGIDHWAVPSTEDWRSVLKENRRLEERVRLLESTCEENGIEVEEVGPMKGGKGGEGEVVIEMSRSL